MSDAAAPPLPADALAIAGRTLRSRLFVGTGKFAHGAVMRAALDAADAEVVTVALRRAELGADTARDDGIMRHLDPERHLIAPNTSGARTAEEAVRLARLGAAAGLPRWVKIEIHPEPRHLMPDPIETLRATEMLAAEDFVCLPYCHADPVLAKRLEEAGAAAVMPLAAPIGTNRGLEARAFLEIIIAAAAVPIVVDAGLGAPSHAAAAMEMGADAVLVNTAIAAAEDPVAMARAFALGVRAGRAAHLAGLPDPSSKARATSPLTGFLD